MAPSPSKLAALLNPAPSTEQPALSTSPDHHHHQHNSNYSSPSFAPLALLPPLLPAPEYPHVRRSSSIHSLLAIPVEPVAVTDDPTHAQPFSPTLQHYHLSSKSPQERRASTVSLRTSPPPVLAPIQASDIAIQQRASLYSPPYPFAPPSNPSQLRVESATMAQPHLPSPDATGIAPHGDSQLLPAVTDVKQEPREPSADGSSLPFDSASHLNEGALEAEDKTIREPLTETNGIDSPGAVRDSPVPTTGTTKANAQSSKKRGPPAGAARKKGTATTKKPPSKKRRLDPDSAAGSGPSSVGRRSETPSKRPPGLNTNLKAPKRGSQAGTPIAGSSPTVNSPADLSDESESDADSDDDGQLFCICRKPDDHKFMIGCDGGCDDWYHGACVGMRKEDSQLIDKYICPKCEKIGRGVTTWKPMCRREGCRQPAKISKPASKFCSEDCGVKFFEGKLRKNGTPNKSTDTRPKRGPKKKEATRADQGSIHSDQDDEEYDPPPRGGVIRARDLKSLASASDTVGAFRRLGTGVLLPGTANTNNTTSYSFTPAESARLAEINQEIEELGTRQALLRDREKFVGLVRDQATRYAEREGLKPKDVCGFDSRLVWSEPEFEAWRATAKGKLALEKGTFDVLPEEEAPQPTAADDDAKMQLDGGNETLISMCTKKRCERHKQWPKLQVQDCRSDEVLVIQSVARLEAKEKEIKESALLRWRMEQVEGKHHNTSDTAAATAVETSLTKATATGTRDDVTMASQDGTTATSIKPDIDNV